MGSVEITRGISSCEADLVALFVNNSNNLPINTQHIKYKTSCGMCQTGELLRKYYWGRENEWKDLVEKTGRWFKDGVSRTGPRIDGVP